MVLEDFKSIPEYPDYLINKLGKVYSLKTGKILKNRIGTHGYWYIKVSHEGRLIDLLIHRALCRVFKNLPDLFCDLEVDHIDRDKTNISLDNLQVLSLKDHKIKTILERGHQVQDNFCPICGKKVKNSNKTCSNCRPRPHPEISVEQIEYWVLKYSWVRASKELGLSDNGLRKRYKSLTGKDPKTLKGKKNA